MKRLNVRSFVIGVALLLSISANAEAGWKYIGSYNGNKSYVYLPIDYDAQYARTISLTNFLRPLDIQGWTYDARSIGSYVTVNCDRGSVKFRSIKAFSNPYLSGHSVSLASVTLTTGVTIRPESTISYDRLTPLGKQAVNYVCR